MVPFGKLFPTQATVQDTIDADLELGRPSRLIILKARRHRISTLMAANIFHGCTMNENKRGYIVAHDTDTTDTLFKMHKVFFDSLDNTMRPMLRLSNRRELLFENPDSQLRRDNPGLRSSLTVRAASSGGKKVGADQGAAGVGRGDRIDYFHGSEVAFWPNGEETFTGFAQAVPEEPGTLVAIESTANGCAGFFFEEWKRAEAGEGYTPIFLPWFGHPHYRGSVVGMTRPEWLPQEDDEKMFDDFRSSMLADDHAQMERLAERLSIDESEERLVRRHEVSWDQLLWRRFAIKYRTRGKETLFRVEYPANPEEAFLSSGTPRFSNQKLRGWVELCRTPTTGRITVEEKDWSWDCGAWTAPEMKFAATPKGWLEMIEPPRDGHQYIIGADVAHGLGKDSSALAVFDRTEKRFVAHARCNDVKPDRFAEWIIMAGHFYNTAYVAPEFNGPGVLTTHIILKSGYPRLYHSQRFNTALQKWTDQPGFLTDQKTRGRIIDLFDVAIENDAVEIPIREILNEALTFVLDDKRKRADHLPGCHDDLLFGAMIAYFLDEMAPQDFETQERPRVPGWSIGPPVATDDFVGDATLEDIDMMFM